MVLKRVDITELVLDPRLQAREVMSQEVIEEYTQICKDCKLTDWPFAEPITIIKVGSALMVVDGFSRTNACLAAGRKWVSANIINGDWEAAVRRACAANATQGQRRTNADKRRAVAIALDELPTMSIAQVAEACRVSRMFVTNVRDSRGPKPDKVKGRDGKEYPAQIKNGAVTSTPEVPPAPAPTPAPTPAPAAKKVEQSPPLAFTGPGDVPCKCGMNDWAETKDGPVCVGCLEPAPAPKPPIKTETLTTGIITLPPIPEATHKALQTAYGRLVREVEKVQKLGVTPAHFGAAMSQLNDLIHRLPVAQEATATSEG